MKRRLWMKTAALALATPAAVAWQGVEAGTVATAAMAEEALWRSRFERPAGSPLQMATLRGKPLVLNFWGTWCPPCVKEMPELDRFHREHAARGWQVLGLAVDNPRAVREFLARKPVGYLIALAGLDGSELARQMGNSGGGLPYTVILDARGAIAQRKSGQTDFAELAAWARAM